MLTVQLFLGDHSLVQLRFYLSLLRLQVTKLQIRSSRNKCRLTGGGQQVHGMQQSIINVILLVLNLERINVLLVKMRVCAFIQV